MWPQGYLVCLLLVHWRKWYVMMVGLYALESVQYPKLRVSEDAGIGHNMHDIYAPIA